MDKIIKASIDLIKAFYEIDSYTGYLLSIEFLKFLDGKGRFYSLQDLSNLDEKYIQEQINLFSDILYMNRFGLWYISVNGLVYLGNNYLTLN